MRCECECEFDFVWFISSASNGSPQHKQMFLQGHQSRKAPLVPKPALRKRRSFKRQGSQHGRGKQPGLLQGKRHPLNWVIGMIHVQL